MTDTIEHTIWYKLRFTPLRDALRGKDAYWAEQVDIQSQVASAWLLYAESKYDEALAAMGAAADAEDRTEKHPVTPGAPRPAPPSMFREMSCTTRRCAGRRTWSSSR